MKRIIATMLLCTGLMAFGQQGDQKEARKMGGKEMTPEQMATLQTKKMTLALDLSTAQQEQIRELYMAQAKLHQEKMESRKAVKETDGAEKSLDTDRYERENERLDNAIARKEKMKEILTEVQYEKWEKMHRKMGRHHHGKRNGDKGHRSHGK